VTIPEDHWIYLAFSGCIADGNGADIILLESGTMGEQALVFLTDGEDQEYEAALAQAQSTNRQDISRIEIDLSANPAPFAARAVRIVGIDLGGGSPGFDLASIQARISRECGPKARYPNPPSGAVNVEPDVRLSWTPGCARGEQQVYFSDIEAQVRSGSADARYPVQSPDANAFQPLPRLGETYYWRVDDPVPADAKLPDSGDVWSFTVSDHLVIDDFEAYSVDGRLREVWQCWGWSSMSLDAVGPQRCDHSLTFSYYYDQSYHAHVSRRFDPAQDWTRAGAKVLQLVLRGSPPDPVSGELYVALIDNVHAQIVPYAEPTDIENETNWYAWRISLDDFNNIDLTQVQGISVGILPRSVQPGQWYEDVISIADISLYRALCLDDRGSTQLTESRPTADLNGDCAVDYRDVERMAADWLRTGVHTYSVAEPNEPVLWYTFDGHARDSAGTAHGRVQGRANYAPGIHGQAIRFTYQGDAVTVPDAASVFAGIAEALTIAFWQYGDDSSHRNDTVCCSNYEYGKSNPSISINLGCWQDPGQYRWDCGSPWSFENRLAGRHRDKTEWAGRWNHWAFTKDTRASENGRMEIYLNGELYDSRSGTNSPIATITSLEIGSGWYGRYDGMIDDFQIYDYALSPAEVAWLATNGAGIIEHPTPRPANLDATDRVALHDFALLATQWLEDALWP
jgi:hypothetical protein